jgi:glucuronokinase
MKENTLIRKRSYPRAGLIGNPSDGYNGKTIAFTFSNFFAEIVLYESAHLEFLPNRRDRAVYYNLHSLADSIEDYGYYGGIRLLQAACKRFCRYCLRNQIELEQKNFSMRYYSNIPHHVGMAGSSAIVTACFRALMDFYQVEIPRHILPNEILAVEADELGISAGLQDRVAQAYQGLVYMDFDKALMDRQGFGSYEPLPPTLLPNLYIAYQTKFAEGSEVFHNDIRGRYNRGDIKVIDAMKHWASLTLQAKQALESQDHQTLGLLLNANFDRRRELCTLSPGNIAMVETARSVGASAKFTGSGGAIVGIYEDEAMFIALKEKLGQSDINVFKPALI